ncbi:MAG: hypothetical protein WAT19_09475 [Ferruginibacter sp.]
MGVFYVLVLAILLPIVLMIAGIVMLLSKDEDKRKRGRYALMCGILIIIAEFLVGYSICSNMSLGPLH